MTIEIGEFGIFRRASETTPEIAQEVERLGDPELHAVGVRDRLSFAVPISVVRGRARAEDEGVGREAGMYVQVAEVGLALRVEPQAVPLRRNVLVLLEVVTVPAAGLHFFPFSYRSPFTVRRFHGCVRFGVALALTFTPR